MFKPGSIRKIEVRNFVTYNYVELYPGPNLNMIIGPNGTGKSTMVAAIILGLGGNPKTVGRGVRISEYVKHGCDMAKINIFLQDVQPQKTIKVSREFTQRDKTQWKLNDKLCSLKDVLECIKQFNIQVDNLCQFLPQDRVADFATLNKKDLLRETQIALCRNDLIDKQTILIEAKNRHNELRDQSTKQAQNLQEAQNINATLEGRIENFNKMRKYQERVHDIERKIAWLEYEEKREKLSQIKEDKTQAQQLFNSRKIALKPKENEIDKYRKRLNEIQHSNASIMGDIRTRESQINTANEKIESLLGQIRDIKDDLDFKLRENQEWDKQIAETETRLEQMKQKLQELRNTTELEDGERQKILADVTKFTTQLRDLQRKKDESQGNCSSIDAEIRALNNEQARIENIKQARLEQLNRYNKDTYAAVLWLRNNKSLFRGEVYEPIMLELNVLDPSKAKYVESTIPLRDRLAFTCTDKQDMNLLLRSLREEQKLSVNVLHSGQTTQRYNQPNIPIEHLRRFGFYTYMNTLFTAPEPIVQYLCKTYNLHNIPIGDSTLNDNFENVPNELKVFYSDRFRYTIRYSKYSREKSSNQNLVRGDGGLSVSLDVVRLEKIKGEYNELKQKRENYQNLLDSINSHVEKLEGEIRANKLKLEKYSNSKQELESMQKKILAVENQIRQMRSNKKNPDTIKKENANKLKALINSVGVLQVTLQKVFKEAQVLMVQGEMNSVKVEALRRRIEILETEMADSKRLLQEAEELLTSVSDKYQVAKREAKNQLEKAKELSQGFTPVDAGFDAFREAYEELENNIELLVAEKENINSKMACLNTADESEIRAYEKRLKQIKMLNRDIEETNENVNKILSKIERLREEWLNPLHELVASINRKFSAAFERMSCAGEVSICCGEDEQNFEEYGLSIKVTYRNGEPLQELNRTVQSGGERAVATAAFMLSLQELTPVPFRCVDEINQGMDANNERRIFELIVDTTTGQNTSQYFLITPKLVPDLRYSRQMKVHIVHNGPFVNADQKWSTSKFCNPDSVRI